MKKNLLLLFICVLLVGCKQGVHSTTDCNLEVESTSNTGMSLTLKEAIEIAQNEAIKWNKEAMLYSGSSVDRDETQTGMDGRRKNWNIQFGIPGKTDLYIITIRDGKVYKETHLPNELDSMPEIYFISNVEEFKHDTPELLKKGQKITEICPGDTFAKGYNFGFTKDPQKKIPLVKVIGWDQSRKSMIYLMFNAITGELEEEFEREQYKN